MKKKLTLCALSAAVLLSGCAGFPANELATVSPQALRSTAPVKTKVFSRWTLSSADKPNEQMTAAIAAINKKHFEKALAGAECCTVVEGPTEADVVVDGTVLQENEPLALIPAVITGLSLYTIPSWVTAKVHIQVQAKGGATTRSYDLKDQMTMVQWLPMLFVMPFTGTPFKAEEEMTANVFNTLVVNIKKDGLIK